MTGYKEFLQAHLPPGAFDISAAGLGRLLAAQAPALDAANTEAGELPREAMPDTAAELLPLWEISYGIEPDATIPGPARVTLLLAHIRARGGLTRQYFIDLAAALGYAVAISEFVPFMAGWGRAGDTVYAPEVVAVWNAATTGAPLWRSFEAGIGRAGDPLGGVVPNLLEKVFNELKPAHTFVFFTYA